NHTGEVLAVAWSPDGRTVLTGAGASTRFWDAATGKEIDIPSLWHFENQGKVQAVAFSPDGKTVATGSWDQTVLLWDVSGLRRGRVEWLPPPPEQRGTSAGMAFSRDGRILVTGGNDRKVRFWDVATGLPAVPALPHPNWVGALALHPDGTSLLTGGRDKS